MSSDTGKLFGRICPHCSKENYRSVDTCRFCGYDFVTRTPPRKPFYHLIALPLAGLFLLALIVLVVVTALWKPVREAVKVSQIPKGGTVSVEAADLTAAYRQNEVGGDLRFRDKQVVVSGEVLSVLKKDGVIAVSLIGGADDFVMCFMKPGTDESVAQFVQRQRVTLSGSRATLHDVSTSLSISLYDCEVVL